MNDNKTVSFPVRMPEELKAKIQAAAKLSGLSDQDLIRLCIRIGLADMDAIEHDAAKLIQQAAEDKGTSFSAWAKSQNEPIPTTIKPAPQGFNYRSPRPLNSKLNDGP